MTKKQITVIGGGIAGMMAAWRLTELGAEVRLISNTVLRRAGSVIIDDGINAVVPASTDSLDQHFIDTVRYGGELANQKPIYQMCSEAPRLVRLLERLGVVFKRTPEERILVGHSIGSSFARTMLAETIGLQTVRVLDGQIRRLAAGQQLELREGTEFVSAVLDSHGACCGVIVQDCQNLKMEVLRTDAIVVCTGDFAALYDEQSLLTTHWGAAIAQLYRQGAALANPEFLQLQDKVVTATLGGLWIDDDHMTSLPGVFAAGDCAALYHGAQRLPGNHILALLHSGLRAAAGGSQYAESRAATSVPAREDIFRDELQRQEFFVQYLRDLNGPENLHVLMAEVCGEFARVCGATRKARDLAELCARLDDWQGRFHRITLFDKGSWLNHELLMARQCDGLLALAQVVATAASLRDETHALKMTKVRWSRGGPKIFYEDVERSRLQPALAGSTLLGSVDEPKPRLSAVRNLS